MIDPTIRRVLDGTPIVHLATLLPDGSPHVVPIWAGIEGDRIAFFTGQSSVKARNLRRDPRVALSTTPEDEPFTPVMVRGRLVDVVDGEPGWEIVDRISVKYTGSPYPREEGRVAFLIEPDHQHFGMG